MNLNSRIDCAVDPRSLCRTCLSPQGLIDVCPKNCEFPHLEKKFRDIVAIVEELYNVTIRPEDDYSTKMCESCIKLVTLFHSSRQYAKTSDCYLRNCSLNLMLCSHIREVYQNPVEDVKPCVSTIEEVPAPVNAQRGNGRVRKTQIPYIRKEIGTTIDTKNILDPKSKRQPKFKSGIQAFVARRKKMKQRMKSMKQKKENENKMHVEADVHSNDDKDEEISVDILSIDSSHDEQEDGLLVVKPRGKKSATLVDFVDLTPMKGHKGRKSSLHGETISQATVKGSTPGAKKSTLSEDNTPVSFKGSLSKVKKNSLLSEQSDPVLSPPNESCLPCPEVLPTFPSGL